jgi:hypothetical protein
MPPRDDDKAMDGLLRRSLASDAAAADACPEPDILAAYCERSLDADEMARHEQHFCECARCREQLVAIFRAEGVTEISAVQEAMGAPATAPRAKAQSPGPASPLKKPARPRILDWLWLAPVAAAILVVVFIYSRNGSRLGKPPMSENEVAMSKPEAQPQAGLADKESSARYQSAPLPVPAKPRAQGNEAAPPVGRESSRMTRNSASTPLRDKKIDSSSALRSEYETGNDLSKRAEAATGTAMEKQAPAELDALSAAKRDEDLARAKSAPSSAPTSAAGPAQAETKMQGTGAGLAGHKSMVGGMANGRNQKQAAADTNGAADVTVMSQMVQVQSAAQMIQTPDASVQYRIQGAGVVERSKDGGATWQGQRVKANAEILAGAAPSENVCWLVGRGGVILMTSDGKHWKKIPSPVVVDFVGVTAADASFATVTAVDGQKFSTQNGGMTWQLMK